MDIAGNVAIVTGGAHRVGRAVSIALARSGADVYVHYNRSAGAAEETVAEICAVDRRAPHGAADLGDPGVAPQLVEHAVEALGPVDILVNSASAFPEDTFRDVTLEGWRRTHELTLAGPVFLTQAFAAALSQGTSGAVVNITDVRTAKPYKRHFSYIVAKGGIDTFTRAAAVALAPSIRVNAVALGVILPPPGEDEAYAEGLARQLPIGRPGGTEPVAAAVVALVENDFITGEIVRVDGGGHLV